MRQIERQVRKRARDVVNSRGGAFVIQCSLVTDVFRQNVRFTMTDIKIKAGHIHTEAKDAIRRHVEDVSIHQLSKKNGLQHERQLPDIVERIDQHQCTHTLRMSQRVHQSQPTAQGMPNDDQRFVAVQGIDPGFKICKNGIDRVVTMMSGLFTFSMPEQVKSVSCITRGRQFWEQVVPVVKRSSQSVREDDRHAGTLLYIIYFGMFEL